MSAQLRNGPAKCGKTGGWRQQLKGLLLVLACTLSLSALSGCAWVRGANESQGTSQPPQIELEAVLKVLSALPDGASVELEFALINHSEIEVYVLDWYTPLEGVFGEIFRVERDGQPVPYKGPLVMRGNPIPENYVWLGRGASAAGRVDLAAAYDFSQPGAYTITFVSPMISHVAKTRDQMTTSVDELGPVEMSSNSVVVDIVGAGGG